MTNDPYGLLASGLPPELAAKVMGATREQQIARALLEQSLGSIQNMGGPGAKLSPFQGLEKMAKAYLGRQGMERADRDYADAADEKRRGVADAIAQYERTKTGTPGIPYAPGLTNDDEGNALPAAPAGVKGDPRKAVMDALSNAYLQGNPMVAMDAKALQPTTVGRSLIVPATGEVVASDPVVKEEREAKREELQAGREARMAELKMRVEDQRLSREERAQAQQDLVRLAASLRTPATPAPLVSIEGPDGRPVLVPREQAAGKTPAGNRVEKALPPSLQKQLTEAAELSDATARFVNTWKDDFGGKTITGGLGNTVGRIVGDDTGQSQWWQDYELHQSQIRNKLFGSALTTAEMAAWEKSAISPRMDPKQITTNLGRRKELEDRALGRLMNGAKAGGYNSGQIEAYTGRSEAPSGAAPTSGAAETKVIKGKTYVKQNGQWYEQ